VTGDNVRSRGTFALATVLAVACYHLSVFGVFFLVPLEWVRLRFGGRSFLTASVLAAAGIVAVEAALQAFGGTTRSIMDVVVFGMPLLLIAGWVALVEMERLGWRFLYRLLAVTAVVGLVLFPVIGSLLAQESVSRSLEQSFDAVWKQMSQNPELKLPGILGHLDRTEFFDLLKEAFLGSFLLVLFLFWAFTNRLARALDPSQEPRTLKDFFVPPQATWVLLGLWGLILVQGLLVRGGVKWEWGFALYVVLNAAWIVLVIHALAGWGILHSLMDRWRWPRFAQGALRVLLVLSLLVPGTGQWVVLIGLPVLAVLELWVNFRNRTQGVGL